MAELKVYLNPNEEEAAQIKKRIEENDGYCPCRLLRTPDNRCMCKSFRERNEEGFCLCGLFYKQYEPEEEIDEAETEPATAAKETGTETETKLAEVTKPTSPTEPPAIAEADLNGEPTE